MQYMIPNIFHYLVINTSLVINFIIDFQIFICLFRIEINFGNLHKTPTSGLQCVRLFNS
jgi:hypothetical protein